MKTVQEWFKREFPYLEINRRWSVLEDTACFLFDLLKKIRPQNVLEMGGGVSTVVIAKALSEWNGHVYSLEHDEQWLGETQKMCDVCGVGNYTLIYAPLVKSGFEGAGEYLIYDPGKIPQRKYEFAFIDGPPGYSPECPGRRGTLYTIFPLLEEKATVLMDDADRDGERSAVMEWMTVFGEALSVRYVRMERPLFWMEKSIVFLSQYQSFLNNSRA